MNKRIFGVIEGLHGEMSDTKQTLGPREEWARLYVDRSNESTQAEKLLREAHFCVIAFPINGKMGPELKLGRHVYRGLEEIRNLIEK
jgi:hypothetical protein